jgi:hypothetical protein
VAVSEVTLMDTGVSGGVEGTDTGSVRVSYTSTYKAKCDDPSDGPKTVLRYFLLHGEYPWPGRTYKLGNDFDTSAVCRSVHPARIDASGGIYLVKCDFRDREDDQQQKEKNPTPSLAMSENPIDWLPEIHVSHGSFSAPVEYATFVGALNAAGVSSFLKPGRFLPLTNSAMEPLDPTIEDEFSYKIIRFSKNVKSYDDAFFNKYQDAVNKAEFTINLPKLRFKTTVAKHYGKLRASASLQFTNGILYYRRELELHIRGWDRAILDQGTRELYVTGDTKPDGTIISASDVPRGRVSVEVPITDDDGLPIDKPRLLDGNGKRLKEGQPPVLLGWQVSHEADFSRIDWV